MSRRKILSMRRSMSWSLGIRCLRWDENKGRKGRVWKKRERGDQSLEIINSMGRTQIQRQERVSPLETSTRAKNSPSSESPSMSEATWLC
jgi:hypothetical protein